MTYINQCSQRGRRSVLSLDEDRQQFVVLSSHFLKSCPTIQNQGQGQTVFCHPVWSFLELAPHLQVKNRSLLSPTFPGCLLLSPTVFSYFLLFFHCFPPSPAVYHHLLLSPTVPYQNQSQIVGLVILPDDGSPGNSRKRTDGILWSGPIVFSSCPTNRNGRRGRSAFCHPISFRALGRLPAGLYRGPNAANTDINFLSLLGCIADPSRGFWRSELAWLRWKVAFSIKRAVHIIRHSFGLRTMDNRGGRKYCLDKTRRITTNQITTVEHHYGELPGIGAKEL